MKQTNKKKKKRMNEKKKNGGINCNIIVEVRQMRERNSIHTDLPLNKPVLVLGLGQLGQHRAVPTEWS